MILPLAGVLFALASAVVWGFADFFGGLSSRRSSHLDVLALSRVGLISVLTVLAVMTRDALPPLTSAGWAAAAGMTGALGIASLYRGLATERSSLVVPAAGVMGAVLPVLFAALVDGFLPLAQQFGLLVALGGIWMVSQGHNDSSSPASRGLLFGALAGVGFGGFFIMLGQVEPGTTFTPLVIAALAGFVVSLIILAIARVRFPVPTKNPTALLTGALDATGVVFYMLAIRWIRLDVAAVLGSLYPAIAVLLFRGVLKEHVSTTQWVGLGVCVVAISLIVV
jgi:drug/metabolite transporter (DMT)-like permease